jgi:hypothetical protein
MSDTQTVIQRGDPAVEKFRLALIEDAKAVAAANAGTPLPRYQIAQFGPLEKDALDQIRASQGIYTPYLNQGSGAITAGQGLISNQGIAGLQQGMGLLGQAAEGVSPFVQQGIEGLQQGIGLLGDAAAGVAPQVQQGIEGLQQGIGLLGDAAAGVAPQVQQAQQALYGATGQFSPSGIGAFMNPYEQAVIDQTMADISRQGDIAQQGVRAQAVGAGAFGGSRQAVAEQELQRNVLEQQARTAGQLRQTGFESASQRAQQAFEQAQGRGLTAAGQAGQLGLAGQQGIGQFGQSIGALSGQAGQLGLSGQQAIGQFGQSIGALSGQAGQLGLSGQQAIGQFGQGIGGLAGQFGTFGSQLGQLGTQQAGIGQLAQQLSTQDIQNLLATGSLERGVRQASLDAERLSNLQNLQQRLPSHWASCPTFTRACLRRSPQLQRRLPRKFRPSKP